MKKLLNKRLLFIVFISLTAISSCKKDFLNRAPIGAIADTYYKNESECMKGVNGVYDVLTWAKTFDHMFWALGDGGTDDCTRACNDGNYSALDLINNYKAVFGAASNYGFELMFTGYYEGIARANSLLARSNDAKVTPEFLNRVQAEAKSLRATYYFMLVTYFGGVPLLTKPENPLDPANVTIPRSSVEEVYAQIEKDLIDAIPYLPLKSKTITDKEPGRMTKGAAGGMLAKVYMQQGKFAEAVAACDAVIQSREYELEASYRDAFKFTHENGIESVFEIQHNEYNTGGWGSDDEDGSYVHVKVKGDDGFGGGWQVNGPSQNLYEIFDTVNDNRYKNTCMLEGDRLDDSPPISFGKIYYGVMAKHWIPNYSGMVNGLAPINWVLIRYADILLMKAEALSAVTLAGNANAEAVNILMAIRTRAKLINSATSDAARNFYNALTSNELLSKVRQERRFEFGMEGWRLHDLRRWGVDSLKGALLNVGKIENAAEFREAWMLYPIPQAVIDLSLGAVKQNPGPWQ